MMTMMLMMMMSDDSVGRTGKLFCKLLSSCQVIYLYYGMNPALKQTSGGCWNTCAAL